MIKNKIAIPYIDDHFEEILEKLKKLFIEAFLFEIQC
jgi:type II restriction/modification system DNA methylase subunit YeeA